MTRLTSFSNEHIHVNAWGEFDKGCICGGGDFYTVRLDKGVWHEIEPDTKWDGWGCINCKRVFNDKGAVIARPTHIKWLV